MPSQLKILDGVFVVCRIDSHAFVPNMTQSNSFYSITREESGQLTIICQEKDQPSGIGGNISSNWRGIKFVDQLEFNMVGIISKISRILASNHIPILTISTYNTDYVFVSSRNLEKSEHLLAENGYSFIKE